MSLFSFTSLTQFSTPNSKPCNATFLIQKLSSQLLLFFVSFFKTYIFEIYSFSLGCFSAVVILFFLFCSFFLVRASNKKSLKEWEFFPFFLLVFSAFVDVLYELKHENHFYFTFSSEKQKKKCPEKRKDVQKLTLLLSVERRDF